MTLAVCLILLNIFDVLELRKAKMTVFQSQYRNSSGELGDVLG